MTVVAVIHDKDYPMDLPAAKRLLNCVYEEEEYITINGETMLLTKDLKDSLLKQLHGELYV